jgi:hypothetical protein
MTATTNVTAATARRDAIDLPDAAILVVAQRTVTRAVVE